MSTKTTFKRIALVAVAALGLGVLTSVAPASAAVQSDALTLSATTATAAIGETATATMSLTFLDTDSGTDTMTATVAVLSSPATSVVTPTLSISAAQTTANTAAGVGTTSVSGAVMTLVSAGTAAGRATGSATMSLVNLAVAGTYVIRVTPAGGLTTTAQTFTVTVAAKPTLTAAASTVLQGYDYYEDAANVAVRGAWAAPSTTTDAVKLSCYAYPGYGCARIKVTQSNGSTTNPLVSADAVALTATVTGAAAIVSITGEGNTYDVNQARGTYAVSSAATIALGLTQYVYVYATGTPGVATVTIKMGDVTFPAKSFNIYEAAKTYTAAVGTGFTGTAFPVGASAAAINVTAKDPSGLLVPGATVYAFSSDATVATVSASSAPVTR